MTRRVFEANASCLDWSNRAHMHERRMILGDCAANTRSRSDCSSLDAYCSAVLDSLTTRKRTYLLLYRREHDANSAFPMVADGSQKHHDRRSKSLGYKLQCVLFTVAKKNTECIRPFPWTAAEGSGESSIVHGCCDGTTTVHSPDF